MKNGSVTDQLKMQEQHIIDEGRMNTDNHVGIYADKQEEMTENKFPNNQSINQEDKKENKKRNQSGDSEDSQQKPII